MSPPPESAPLPNQSAAPSPGPPADGSIDGSIDRSIDQPIGVFDSGVGGLTVVRAVLSRLPAERLVYLGDTARVPYGMRSAQTVLRYSRNAARFLLKQDVKMVLIACNTASAAALEVLQQELPVGVLGAVEPGAEAASQATRSGTIGVIGTLATVRSGAYERALRAIDPAFAVHALACPLLVPLVEEGWNEADDPVSTMVVRRYLTELARRAPELDTLVLGCTHYPLLHPVLHRVAAELWGHDIALVDSATAMAEAAARELGRRGLLRTAPDQAAPGTPPRETLSDNGGGRRSVDRMRCFVTDEARVAEIAARFLGRAPDRIELCDL